MSKNRRDIDKDTVVAYHDFIQGQIRGELNGVNLGPGRSCCLVAGALLVFGFILGIVGILVITLRTRHVYLWDWNDQFLGPAFVVMMLMCVGLAVFLLVEGKRRANAYRRELVFRPIGDYGVAVVHKSRLNYEEKTRDNLKSGTTPHKPIQPKPYQPITYDHEGRPKNRGYENRAYDDPRGPPPQYEERRRHPDDRDRRPRGPPDGRRPPGPRGPDDRSRSDRPRMPQSGRRGPPGGPDDRPRRPPGPDDRRRRPPGPGDRRRPPGPDERPRRPPGPDDRPRRDGPPGDRYRDDRRRMEEDRRREDRRRMEEEKRREAEGEPRPDVEKPAPAPGFRLPPITDESARVLLNKDGQHESESEL